MSKNATSASAKDQDPRPVLEVISPGPDHWVGDGFFVRSVFTPGVNTEALSPFLLLDYAAPRRFAPAPRRRGVGEHPHRGFETVTFAFRGEVEHRDSTGAGGRVGPGDVQWMTAASGVVHEEMHSQSFTERGGDFEMAQLWVNLPASKKMSEPRYQAILDRDLPRLVVGAATARLVAGRFQGVDGPTRTHSPIIALDLEFSREGTCELELPQGWTTIACALQGDVLASEGRPVPTRHAALFDRDHGGRIRLQASRGTHVLVLSGEPLNEPVVAYGPFVMNTREEIVTAIRDYQSGRMGTLL